MIEGLIELLLQFFGEFILQIGFEWLGEGFKTAWNKLTGRDKESSPARETLWALGTGALCGGLTLLLFPALAIRWPWLQMLNLVAAPLVAGLMVERLRAWRESRREFSTPVFAYAALFGFAFALTRFGFGH
jgi:fatty acid desaturase